MDEKKRVVCTYVRTYEQYFRFSPSFDMCVFLFVGLSHFGKKKKKLSHCRTREFVTLRLAVMASRPASCLSG